MNKTQILFPLRRDETDRGLTFCRRNLRLRVSIAEEKDSLEVFVRMRRAVGYSHPKRKTNSSLFDVDLISAAPESA
jgi:hypothetical protein